MSLRKITRIVLSLGFVFAFTVAASVSVVADEPVKPERSYKRKPCKDDSYDRNAGAEDEERTSGDCSGTVPTPEPVSILLFTAGLAGVGFAARRRLRRSE